GVQDPGFARVLTGAMHSMSIGPASAWPRACAWQPEVLLDIGGGSGIHAVSAAQHWPSSRAIVLDLPMICTIAQETIDAHGVSERVGTHAANMWIDTLPPADTHFYGQVFHDWPLTRCALLAKRSFESLPPGGHIVVHEMLFDTAKTGPL